MHSIARRPKVAVSADGKGLVSQAGAVLLFQALRVTGLDRGLPLALGRWRAPQAVHDPGKIIADLAVAVAMHGARPGRRAGLSWAGPAVRWLPDAPAFDLVGDGLAQRACVRGIDADGEPDSHQG